MGRRKIEIKAIKDDRNRSVTFLKRKGGLFKKAHELSVLCSVDVAVIIFGHNKKLYEFSSGDINETIGRHQYYGGAHEHKGPEDFKDKNAGSDDEDEDIEDIRPESRSPPQGQVPTMAQHLHTQHQFSHMGSASPPMPNGAFQHRGPSPQPPHNISRPGSRTHLRQPSQHLAPPQHPQHPQHPQVSQPPPQQQPSYAYMPNPPIYNPQAAANMGMRPQPQPGQLHPPQFQQYAQPAQPHPQQHPGQPHPGQHPAQHPQQHPQVQQLYAQEQQRRQSGSVPPQFPQQHPPPPQQGSRQAPHPQPSPQPQPAQFSSPPLPQPKPLPASAKTHSIFTPIDDSRSLLAQHWGASREEVPKSEPVIKQENERSQSIDVASISRSNGIAPPPHIDTRQQAKQPQRTASTPVIPSIHAHPPSRTNSLQTKPRGPKLKVQIPNEDSGDEGRTADTSPQATAAAIRTPIRDHPGVVLPPPSPSASALLSAGASGPPNPFARPPPPGGVNGYSNRNDLETPISALPSRFVSDQLLPSPSSFYAEWFSNGSATRENNNMLPSPLAFPTPVAIRGPSFGDDDERKRKMEESNGGTPEKRIKT